MMNIMRSIGTFLLTNWKGSWVGFSVLVLLSGVMFGSQRTMVMGIISLIFSGITIANGWGMLGGWVAKILSGGWGADVCAFGWSIVFILTGSLLFLLDIDYQVDQGEMIVQLLGTHKPMEMLVLMTGWFLFFAGTFLLVKNRLVK